MSRSEALFERAQHTIPGGVNSPVRAFKAVGGTPRFMERADGAYLFDILWLRVDGAGRDVVQQGPWSSAKHRLTKPAL